MSARRARSVAASAARRGRRWPARASRAGACLLGVLASVALGGAEAARARTTVLAPGGDALARALAAAVPGDVIELGPGVFAGPIHLERAVVLRGRGGVIDGGDGGTVVRISAPGARLEGVRVRGSGRDLGAPDACVYVTPTATGAVLRGNALDDCAFGVWVHQTESVRIVDNTIRGRPGVRVADRGNGIHLFDAAGVVVDGNRVEGVRDGIYVSATEDSRILDNEAHDVRFGIHYMYSWDNTVRGNRVTDSVIGLALMESRRLVVEDNVATGNVRQGLLFRDVQSSRIRGNHLERNGNGLFFYSSVGNVIADNVVVDNDMGLKVWAGTRRNRVEGNLIRGNREPVHYVGAEDQVWGTSGRGNRWGGYLGWDQDGDGIGDRPHRVDGFTADLVYRHPAAVLLLRSPALETLAHLADRLPFLRVPTIVDRAPIVGDVPPPRDGYPLPDVSPPTRTGGAGGAADAARGDRP